MADRQGRCRRGNSNIFIDMASTYFRMEKFKRDWDMVDIHTSSNYVSCTPMTEKELTKAYKKLSKKLLIRMLIQNNRLLGWVK